MAYRAYRPSSAHARPLKKTRGTRFCTNIEKTLNFDPWASMYKENFCVAVKPETLSPKDDLNDPKTSHQNAFAVLTETVNQSKPRPTTAQRPASAMRQSKKDPERSKVISKSDTSAIIIGRDGKRDSEITQNEVKKSILKRENNFFKKMTPNSSSQTLEKSQRQRPSSAVSSGNLEPKVSIVSQKDNGFNNASNLFAAKPTPKTDSNDKLKRPDTPTKTITSQPGTICGYLPQTNPAMFKTTDALVTELPGLPQANATTPFMNIVGQPEEWLDVRDKLNPPVHSKTVTYIPNDFLRANVKSLVNTVNEYYPYLTGVCLCKDCICGNCRCVHFKYKAGQNIFSTLMPGMDNFTTEYKTEFYPKKTSDQRRKAPTNELSILPFKLQPDTTNSNAFKKPVNDGQFNNIPFLNRSKINNLGPTVCYLPCPLDGLSSYKRDYPDWKCAMPGKLPRFAPATLTKGMPFMGKPANRDYGSYFGKGQTPDQVTAFVPENRNNIFPNVSGVDLPNQTDYQRNYQPKYLGDDPLRQYHPIDNLESEVT